MILSTISLFQPSTPSELKDARGAMHSPRFVRSGGSWPLLWARRTSDLTLSLFAATFFWIRAHTARKVGRSMSEAPFTLQRSGRGARRGGGIGGVGEQVPVTNFGAGVCFRPHKRRVVHCGFTHSLARKRDPDTRRGVSSEMRTPRYTRANTGPDRQQARAVGR